MDPLSIVGTAFGLATGVAQTSIALASFAREVRDAKEDLDAISAELQALAAVIDPLARSISQANMGSMPEALLRQIDTALVGTASVVEQIEENVQKYKSNKVFSKAAWVVFGQGDMRKLRESLEAYKMALSLGMHVVTVTVYQAVKEDTSAIREYAAAIKINTEDILARVNSIRRDDHEGRHRKVEDWMEDIAVLSSYAETTYQGTVVNPSDMPDVAQKKCPFCPRIRHRH